MDELEIWVVVEGINSKGFGGAPRVRLAVDELWADTFVCFVSAGIRLVDAET